MYAWPVIKSNFILYAENDQAYKIIVQAINLAKFESSLYNEVIQFTIKNMMKLASCSSGTEILQSCAMRLVADNAFDFLYTFAKSFFEIVFLVHERRPDIDLLKIWSTVLCTGYFQQVHSVEGWSDHQSLDHQGEADLHSPLLAHIKDLFENQIVKCNSKMASVMANHLVKNVEIYKVYKTIIKNLFDKMILLISRIGFEVVQQSLFKKLCCNDIKFLIKQIEKNIKKVLKSNPSMNFFSWILRAMSSTNFAVFVRDLTFYQPTTPIKSDLL